MTTPLTLYVTNIKTGTLAELQLSTAFTSTATHTAGRIGTSTHLWPICFGTASNTTATLSVPTTLRGALWKAGTLKGKQIVAGTWSVTVRLKLTTSTATGTLRFAVYRKNGSTYIQIGTPVSLPSVTVNTTFATHTISGSLPAAIFGTTTHLYVGVYFVGHSGSASDTILKGSIGLGYAKIVTPGYVTPVPLMAMPTIKIQIGLTGNIWTGSNWVTIGPFVWSFSIVRGREHQTQRCEPGQLTLELDNTDGRFNPWAKTGPYYNQLTATDSSFTTGVGSWFGTTVARSSTFALYGTTSLKLTTTASSGTASATVGVLTGTKIYPVTPGRLYSALLSVRPTSSYGKTATLTLRFYKSTGAQVGSTFSSAAVAPTSGTWTQYSVSATAPAEAAFVTGTWQVGVGAKNQSYYLDCAGLFDLTYTRPDVPQGWCVGKQTTLNPSTPIRVFATWEDATSQQFGGFVGSWVPKYGTVLGKQAVTAHDYMKLLALAPALPSDYAALVLASTPAVYWRLNTAPGSGSAKDSSGNGHTGTVSPGVAFGQPGGLFGTPATAVKLTAATVHAAFPLTVNGCTSECVMEHTGSESGGLIDLLAGSARLRIPSSTPHGLNLYYQNSGGTFVTAAVTTLAAGWHHIAMTRSTGGSIKVYVDGTLEATVAGKSGSTTHPNVGVGSSVFPASGLIVQEVAFYPTVLTATTIAAHHTAFTAGIAAAKSGVTATAMMVSAGVPTSAFGTIATGTVTCNAPLVTLGQTQLLSTIQTIENTEQGLLYCAPDGKITYLSRTEVNSATAHATSQATFASDTTPAHYRFAVCPVPSRDDQTLFNYIPVGVQGSEADETSATYFATTQTSIEANGARVLTGFTGLYFETPATAQELASALLFLYATPLTRIRSLVVTTKTTRGANVPLMLSLTLLDAITVIWQPIDGSDSPFVQQSNIEQVKHVVTPASWTTTWALAATIRRTWFTLTSATLGTLAGPGSTAANRLGF